MTDFTIHSLETAPETSVEVLEQAKKTYGRIPNLLGTLAESPEALKGYSTLSNLVGSSSLTAAERTVAWQTLNAYHNCEYCMAAHTAIAHGENIDSDVIETARAVESYDDPKLEALRRFVLAVSENRGWVSDDDVDVFLEAGFTRQNVLEVVLVTAQKVISNYVNHITDTPLDRVFQKFEWKQPEAVSA